MGCCNSVPTAPDVIIPDPLEQEGCTFSLKSAGMMSKVSVCRGDSQQLLHIFFLSLRFFTVVYTNYSHNNNVPTHRIILLTKENQQMKTRTNGSSWTNLDHSGEEIASSILRTLKGEATKKSQTRVRFHGMPPSMTSQSSRSSTRWVSAVVKRK